MIVGGRWSALIALVALTVLWSPAAAVPHPGHAGAAQSTDVLLAFDATSSMGPSIAAAQHDAQTIISAVGELAPNTHFAVASFRDRFYPGGPYTLLSPMTESRDSLVSALGRLQPVSSTNEAKDTNAEAYNLLFNKSYTDTTIGWRASARKIVVVIGDAEPHGAGTDGLPGCADTTSDWDGLSTAHELAEMRATKRTLVMIRQSQTATTSLACYSALASRAYEGGTALNGGGGNIAGPVLALVKHAYAPFDITAQLVRGVAHRSDGLTIRIANPNSFPLSIPDLSLTLPRGIAYLAGSSSGGLGRPQVQAGRLTWKLRAPLSPSRVLLAHVALRIGNLRAATLNALLHATTPDGAELTLSAKAALRFVPRPVRASLAVNGRRGSASITGTVRTGVTTTAKAPASKASGSLLVNVGRAKSVTVRPVFALASAVGAPTRATLHVVVSRSHGFPACHSGVAGVVTLTDSDALVRVSHTRDRVTFTLPASCGGTQIFADATPGARLSIKLGFL
jgi:hypothetical protein